MYGHSNFNHEAEGLAALNLLADLTKLSSSASSKLQEIVVCLHADRLACSTVLHFEMDLKNQQNDSTCGPFGNIRVDMKSVNNALFKVHRHFFIWSRNPV